MKRIFNYTDEKTSKFWAIETNAASFTVMYGKTGAAGQTQTKSFASEAECQKEAQKLVNEKTKKGYVEQTTQVAQAPVQNPPITCLSKKETEKKFDLWKQKKLWDFPGDYIFYCDGDLTLDTARLDWIQSDGLQFVKTNEADTCAGLIVNGNLTINGCLYNGEIDFGQVLYVNGNLTAKNIALGGAQVYVEGNVQAEVIWTTYNHGLLHINGNVTASLLLIEDHYTVIKGKINATCIDVGGNGEANLPDNETDYTSVFLPEMIELNDEFSEDDEEDNVYNRRHNIKTGELFDALVAGQPVLKTAPAPQPAAAPAGGVIALNDDNFADLLTLVDPEEAETTYKLSDHISLPYLDFYGKPDDMGDDDEVPPKVCVYKGNLHVASIETGMKSDYAAFSLVVDGNLTVDGDIDWGVELDGCFLLVTGNVTCKNLLLSGVCEFVVLGNLTVENGILGHYGDDGGFLDVQGVTKAATIVNVTYFNMSFAQQPQAIVIGDDYRTGCALDFDDEEEAEEALLPKFWDDSIDSHAVKEAFKAGKPILRKTAIPASEALLKKLNAMLEKDATITELDLSDQRLKKVPDQVFSFRNLKKLDLSRNSFNKLTPRIAELEQLEELNLYYSHLPELPDEIGNLKALHTLDLRGSAFTQFPAGLSKLKSLKTLYLNDIKYTLPDEFVNNTTLEKLHLDKVDEDMSAVFKLKTLKSLTIENTPLANIGERFLQLPLLEELSLEGLGRVKEVADLSKLTHLRYLYLDGFVRPRPNPEFLFQPQLWNIPSLEVLDLSRWGEQTDYSAETKKHEVTRKNLDTLPDYAFDNMPKLKKLEVSFTKLESLPDSFFKLKNLEEVKLEYAELNEATVKRIYSTFPTGVKFDIRRSKTGKPNEDNEVNKLVKKGAELMGKGKYADAMKEFEKAIKLCDSGKPYSDYNRLYAQYGLTYSLNRIILNLSGKERDQAIQQVIGYSRKALELIPASIWIFTDEGQFQREVIREAGNALGWFLMETGHFEEALGYINRAVEHIDNGSHLYINDTKVRILLKLNRADEAYRIVQQVLERDPDFDDFKDLKKNKTYLKWKEDNS